MGRGRPFQPRGSAWLVGSLALGLALAGCATGSGGGEPSSASAEDRVVRVRVENGNTSDIVVYALSGGQYNRLGDVTGNHRAMLRLPAHLSGASDVRLVADPIGSRTAYFSERILFSPGDTIVLDVGPTLNLSSVYLRSGGRE